MVASEALRAELHSQFPRGVERPSRRRPELEGPLFVALTEGLVAGGGTTLLQAIPALDKIKLDGDAQVGVDIVRKALEAPARQIADNAGQSGEVVVNAIRAMKLGEGYDALAGEYGDMYAAGIIDPTKVVRAALQNAASIAGLLLTTDTKVTELKDEKKAIGGSVS